MALIGVKLPPLSVINDGCTKPARLQDNIDSGYAVWTWWENITKSAADLTATLEEANGRLKSRIVNSRALRSRNG